jgi:hypothetical protein
VADLLDRIRGEIRERLAASRRAVEEYERLVQVLKALDAGGTARARRAAASPSRRAPSASGTAAQRQANRERLLAALAERPGITREELRATTGLTGASVAQNLRRLVEQREIHERELPDGGTGFTLATSASGDFAPQGRTGEAASEGAHAHASAPSTDATPAAAPTDGPTSASTPDAGVESEGETAADVEPPAPRARRSRSTSARSRAKRAAKTPPPGAAATDAARPPAASDSGSTRDTGEPTDTSDATVPQG